MCIFAAFVPDAAGDSRIWKSAFAKYCLVGCGEAYIKIDFYTCPA